MSEEEKVISITGKVSYDELDPALLKEIREGGSRIIDEKFKILDPKGIYEALGLGKEFTLPDFIKAVADLTKKINDIEKYIKADKDKNYSREIELLKRQIKNLEDENKKIKEAIKNGTVKPDVPSTDPNESYSDDKNDYETHYYDGHIGIAVGDHELNVPTDMFVSEKRLGESSVKNNNLDRYIDENEKLISNLSSINNEISKN